MYRHDQISIGVDLTTLNQQAVANAWHVAEFLKEMSSTEVARRTRAGALVSDQRFGRGRHGDLGAFYAPFDWINTEADIVIVGITPGMRQAETALLTLRQRLITTALDDQSMARALNDAKKAASFEGPMRGIAAQLMDHFGFHHLFGLETTAELFGKAANRAHYTSVYRYPVLQEKAAQWRNYSGGEAPKSRANPLLARFVEEYLIPELMCFKSAWIVPFGPTPAAVLNDLGKKGIIDQNRILSGLNHPSGEQWNRHNCQLDRVDHAHCAKNVGCAKVQDRSRVLRSQMAALVGQQIG